MNPLKDNPHLFANGEFKFMYEDCVCSLIELDICDGSPFLLFDGVEQFWASHKNSTLIARPILDMNESEINRFADISAESTVGLLAHPEDAKTAVAMRMGTEKLSYSEFEFLNDNGFYHGSQSHFDDGTVIDKNEL